MNESRYKRWCKAVQGTVSKCTQFELNSLMHQQPVKAITIEDSYVTETRAPSYHRINDSKVSDSE